MARDNGIELPPDAGLKNARAVAAARWIEREVEERERLARALAQRGARAERAALVGARQKDGEGAPCWAPLLG